MRILYDNFIDDLESTAFTVASQNANYPITNAQDQRLTTEYRTEGITGQSIIINLGSAMAINSVAILSHNISSASTASVILEANSSNSWPGATSQTITWNRDTMLKFFTAETYQYWKFSFEDPDNTDGYLSFGRIWLGDYLQIDPSCLVGFKVVKKNSDNINMGKHRQIFATPGTTWRRFEMSFPKTAHTTIAEIEDMYDIVGNHSPVIFCKFDTVRTYQIIEPCYCVIDGEIGFTHEGRQYYSYSLNLEEVK